MTKDEALVKYCMRLGDDSLIHGHRLSELCSKGPFLEEDIAVTNISLDLVGQARHLYQHACEVEGEGRTEDDLAYKRAERDFYNHKLMELPNGDFAVTMGRIFLKSTLDKLFYSELGNSKDEQLSALAKRAIKEVTYHQRHSAQWVIRLGDGTEESHERMQLALIELWPYTGELFEMDDVDKMMVSEGIGVNTKNLKKEWDKIIDEVLEQATLKRPEDGWMHSGGRQGIHTEYLGYILAEMQYLPRAYPDADWS